MDTSEVEKFFAVWPEDNQQKGQTLVVRTASAAENLPERKTSVPQMDVKH